MSPLLLLMVVLVIREIGGTNLAFPHWFRGGSTMVKLSPLNAFANNKMNTTTTQICDSSSFITLKDARDNLFELSYTRAKDAQEKARKKVLILMSDTGGGHRATAQALDSALKLEFPGQFDCKIMDIWTDHAVYPFSQFVPNYRFLAKHPLLWRGMYAYGMFPPTKFFTEQWSSNWCFKNFKKAIVDTNPDLVVSVHPLCQQIPLTIVEKMNQSRKGKRIPFITVVTDLGGAHPTWFDKRVDACFVPSEAIRKAALKSGMNKSKLIMHGLAIRPKFWKRISMPKNELRKKLGLQEKPKTVMVMGGGDGVGGLSSIAQSIANELTNQIDKSQVVVICGHNTKVQESLKTKKWPSNVNVVVKGFCSNIDEYMSAVDCLITKAGPGTIAEAMTRGLPMILSSFLPGQEAGNVPFVTQGGFGVYTGMRPKKIAEAVSLFFKNDQLLSEMSSRALKAAKPDATIAIARDIANIALSSTAVSK